MNQRSYSFSTNNYGNRCFYQVRSPGQAAVGPNSGRTGPWKLTSQPWNSVAGLPDPGQMRSFTLNYRSGSRRALNSSVASCFCVTSNRCDCGHSRSSRFCKGASSSRLGSRKPDDSISVKRWGAHNPLHCLWGQSLQKAETHSGHASMVVLAVYKRRSCLRP